MQINIDRASIKIAGVLVFCIYPLSVAKRGIGAEQRKEMVTFRIYSLSVLASSEECIFALLVTSKQRIRMDLALTCKPKVSSLACLDIHRISKSCIIERLLSSTFHFRRSICPLHLHIVLNHFIHIFLTSHSECACERERW